MKAAAGWIVLGFVVGAFLAWTARAASSASQERRLEALLADSALFHVKHQATDSTLAVELGEARAAAARSRELTAELNRTAETLGALTAAGQVLAVRTATAELALERARTTRDSLTAAVAAIADYQERTTNLEVRAATADAMVGTLTTQLAEQLEATARLTIALEALGQQDASSHARIRALEAGLAEKLRRPPAGRLLGFLPKPRCGITIAATGALLRRAASRSPEPGLAGWEALGAGCTIGL